ncbi:hypothetical protein BJY04DRAFT_168608 [Aspergillus karnatakaensis]|uniref:uncharacterized protein n=1 Tax=Aspergillus karnatakaensis TaxID=1810916 RepID=UPI003CCCC231
MPRVLKTEYTSRSVRQHKVTSYLAGNQSILRTASLVLSSLFLGVSLRPSPPDTQWRPHDRPPARQQLAQSTRMPTRPPVGSRKVKFSSSTEFFFAGTPQLLPKVPRIDDLSRLSTVEKWWG